MKYFILILFFTFAIQNDSIKVKKTNADPSREQIKSMEQKSKLKEIRKELNTIDSNLDSIIIILKKDSLKRKK